LRLASVLMRRSRPEPGRPQGAMNLFFENSATAEGSNPPDFCNNIGPEHPFTQTCRSDGFQGVSGQNASRSLFIE
jgi:hypothetical protein